MFARNNFFFQQGWLYDEKNYQAIGWNEQQTKSSFFAKRIASIIRLLDFFV